MSQEFLGGPAPRQDMQAARQWLPQHDGGASSGWASDFEGRDGRSPAPSRQTQRPAAAQGSAWAEGFAAERGRMAGPRPGAAMEPDSSWAHEFGGGASGGLGVATNGWNAEPSASTLRHQQHAGGPAAHAEWVQQFQEASLGGAARHMGPPPWPLRGSEGAESISKTQKPLNPEAVQS